MLLSVLIFINFLSKSSYYLAAFLGGLGFGTFIDELGKFITHDNNYFFEPTISLIYVIFVLIYILVRAVRRYSVSKQEYMINAIEAVKEAILNDLDKDEKQKAYQYLKVYNKKDLFYKAIKEVLQKLETVPPGKENILNIFKERIQGLYNYLIHLSVFRKIFILTFIIYGLFSILYSLSLTEFLGGGIQTNISGLSFGELGDLIFSTLSAVFILIGAGLIYHSRLRAYKMFKIAVLISIFLTQFFIFYDIQFAALYSFTINIVLLFFINGIIHREQNLRGIRT